MQQINQEPYPYQTDEIDLRKLFNSLVARKKFIFGLTGFVTLLAIIYSLILTPTYKTTSLFVSPSDSSIFNINKLKLTSESKESVFSTFLSALSSNDLKLEVFNDGGYLNLVNPDNEPIDDVDGFISRSVQKALIAPPGLTLKELELGFLTEPPYSISMEGSNTEFISSYLNDLVVKANIKAIANYDLLIKQKIASRLDELSVERRLLLTRAQQDRLSQIERIEEEDAKKIRVINDQIDALRLKAQRDRLSQIERIKEEDAQKIRVINDQIDALRLKAQRDRLSQIERIKEEDAQKIRVINDQIDRARYKTKEDRLNQVVVLTDAAKLAGSLGIIENNLEKISNSVESDFNLNIAINDDEDLPEWYLYGEKALLERVELLENRTSDDPFIPELVSLLNQINEVQNNNLLKTLEARQNDDPFIPEIVDLQKTLKEVQLNNTLKTLEERLDDSPFIGRINELDIEQIKLESSIVDLTGANSMTLIQAANVPTSPIKPNKRMIVLIAFIGGFMMSIFLALVMGALKPDEENST